jgi:hypothetical protein
VVRTDSFMVTPTQRTGTTRMRVATDLGNSQLSSIRATLGVFKDFTLNLPVDTVRPVVQLAGANPLYVEKSKAYVDPGVIAIDNLEGNISHKYEIIGSVDTSITGPNYLTYVVRDLYGNVSNSVTRTVFVELNRTGPSISLVGPSVLYSEVNQPYTDPGVTAKDNQNNDISNQVQVNSNLDVTKLGSYSVSYRITDAFGLSAQVTRLVTIGDSTRPVVQAINGNPYVHQVAQQLDLMTAVKPTDNYWPEKNILLSYNGFIDVNKVGTYYIIYSARDGSGNISNDLTLTIEVRDTVRPTLLLQGLPEMNVEVFNTFIDPGYLVSDNYWPQNAITVTSTSNVNTSVLGSYSITYTATDASLNKVSVTRRVNVVKTSLPVIRLLGSDPLNVRRFSVLVDPGVALDDVYFTDEQLRPNLVVDASKVNTSIPGLYAIRYNVTDPLGNKADEVVRKVNVMNTTDGLEDASTAKGFHIYPVPTQGTLNINGKGMKEIKVFNILGELVLTRTSADVTNDMISLNLDKQKAGVYILRIESEAGSFSKKINLIR